MDSGATVASRLAAALSAVLGTAESPWRLRAWDGSEAGPPGAPVVAVRSPTAVRRLARQRMARQRADALFESCSVTLPADTDLHALGARLAAADSGVLRAKGVVGGKLLQVAGGRWAVTSAGAGADTPLVLIGLRGSWDPQALLQRCAP